MIAQADAGVSAATAEAHARAIGRRALPRPRQPLGRLAGERPARPGRLQDRAGRPASAPPPRCRRAQRQLDVIDSQRKQADAALAQAKAELDVARLNLSTPSCARRSTASSATAGARRRVRGGRPASCWWSCRRTACGSTPTSRKTSWRGCASGQAVDVHADVVPGRAFHGPRGQPRAGHRRAVQRAAAGERHRQLHQDRAARAGAHLAGRQGRRPALLRPGLSVKASIDTKRGSARVMSSNLRQPARQAQKVFAFASMCVGMFIALLDIQIVSASLRDIGGGLSAGADDTAWVQTSYLIAEIVVIPLSGWLSPVFSTRWLFAASAAGFTAASLLCGIAWDIQSMIAFRALQGFLGGSMIPMVFTSAVRLLRRQAARDRRGHHRRAGLAGADAGPDARRLDHRPLLVALAVLHQPRAGPVRHVRRADAGAHRPARPVAAQDAATTSASR